MPFHGGKGEVISCSGHFKLPLTALLKDFSQLLLLNLHVLGKPAYPSLPICVSLVRNITLVFYAFTSMFLPGNLREGYQMQLGQYQTFVWSILLPAFQTANSRSNFSFQIPGCSLGLSTQDGIYFTHIWQVWWILESKKGFCVLVSRCPLTEQSYWYCIICLLLKTGKPDYQNAFKTQGSPRLKQILFWQGPFPAPLQGSPRLLA